MRRALLAAAVLSFAAAARAREVPFLSSRVTDEARLLDAGSAAALEATLKAYEDRTGRQLAVLTVPSLEGEALEDYSLKVARTWKLGRKDKDDGVLILVARDEHKVRIEVGYGLEGDLPDSVAGRVIREVMVPRFRSGAFAAGIREGAGAVIAALDHRPLPPPPPSPAPARSAPSGFPGEAASDFIMFLVGLLLVPGALVVELDEMRTTGLDLNLYLNMLLLMPIFAMFLSLNHPFWPVMIALGFHLIAFPIGKLAILETPLGERWRKKRKGRHAGKDFFFDSSGGGSMGDSGFFSGGGGGGFSGGGGSFGGGGASGSW